MLRRQAPLLPFRQSRAARPHRRAGAGKKGPLHQRHGEETVEGRDRRRGPGGHDRRLRTSGRRIRAGDRRRGAGLVRAQRRTGAERQRHHQPRTDLWAEQRTGRFLWLHRRRARRLPGSDEEDRPARTGAGDRPSGGRRSRSAVRALRRHPRQRSQNAADHQLRRKPGRDRRSHWGPDLGWVQQRQRGSRPGNHPADRRPADQPQTDQPDAGLGDPRQRSARPGRQGRDRRPGAGDPLPAPLLPLPRPDRLDRPRCLRGDLLRPDRPDPDHPHPAGHRRAGADDRRGRRRRR